MDISVSTVSSFLDHCDSNGGFKGQRGKGAPSTSTPGGATSQLEQSLKKLNLSGTVRQEMGQSEGIKGLDFIKFNKNIYNNCVDYLLVP